MKTDIHPSATLFTPSLPNAMRMSQRGLSLIELMISITLGLIILASLSALFVNQSRSRVELDKSNRMIDNGRYAMDLLAEDLRLAGYLGEYVPKPTTCSNAPVGIGGVNVGTTQAIGTSPYAEIPTASLKTGSDMLIIRRTSTENAIAATAAIAGVPYFQASLCRFDTRKYVSSSTPGDFTTLRPGTCVQGVAQPFAVVRRMLEHAYFVDVNNVAGDGIPTLKRLETSANGALTIVPLVEGVEFMQIEYGIDTNGSFTLMASTTAGGLNLIDLSADPVQENIQVGMGVYSQGKIPAGYTVATVTAATSPLVAQGSHLVPKSGGLPYTNGSMTLNGGATIVAASAVPLTLPYLTGTIESGTAAVTTLSADPVKSLALQNYEICASGIPAGTTIAAITATQITLSKNAISSGTVELIIPDIVISPKTEAGDGVADSYTAAPTDADWQNIVSVKISLLARNTEPTKGYTDTKTYDLGKDDKGIVQTKGPFLDGYKRHVYTKFVRLVNMAGRREIP